MFPRCSLLKHLVLKALFYLYLSVITYVQNQLLPGLTSTQSCVKTAMEQQTVDTKTLYSFCIEDDQENSLHMIVKLKEEQLKCIKTEL